MPIHFFLCGHVKWFNYPLQCNIDGSDLLAFRTRIGRLPQHLSSPAGQMDLLTVLELPPEGPRLVIVKSVLLLFLFLFYEWLFKHDRVVG